MVQTARIGKDFLEFLRIKLVVIHLCTGKKGYMGNIHGMFYYYGHWTMVFT